MVMALKMDAILGKKPIDVHLPDETIK
jgi:hypothetical protein